MPIILVTMEGSVHRLEKARLAGEWSVYTTCMVAGAARATLELHGKEPRTILLTSSSCSWEQAKKVRDLVAKELQLGAVRIHVPNLLYGQEDGSPQEPTEQETSES